MDDNEAMLPEFTPVFIQTSVPTYITEYMEDLIQKVENTEEKNTQLKKQIAAMKEKLGKLLDKQTVCRKNRVELLMKFRKTMERNARANNGHCRNYSSPKYNLKTTVERISGLLDEIIEETNKIIDIKQTIKELEVTEEKMLHEIEEFKEQIQRRKADTRKHFPDTKLKARSLRQQIEADLQSTATTDLILALQKEVTDLVLSQAHDEVPKKIAAFEEEATSQALEEVKEEIALKDQGIEESVESIFEEESRDERREGYMKWLFTD